MRRTRPFLLRAPLGAVVLPALFLLLLSAAPTALQGQMGFALTGGVDGTRPQVHTFFGAQGGILVARGVGIDAHLLEGRGAGYDSRFLAGGPVWRFLSFPGGDVRVWAGPGWYRETLSEHGGVDPRSVTVGAGGVVGRIPMGPVRLLLGVVGWRGTLEGEGFRSAETVSGVRLTVGVGR